MDEPDFSAAEMFLKQAREAHEAGDKQRCIAACKLVVIALTHGEMKKDKAA